MPDVNLRIEIGTDKVYKSPLRRAMTACNSGRNTIRNNTSKPPNNYDKNMRQNKNAIFPNVHE